MSPGEANLRIMGASFSGPGRTGASRWPWAPMAAARVFLSAPSIALARRIDVGDDHAVGVVEAGREGVEQRSQTRVAVRLDDRDHLAGRGRASGLEHRRNLDRMVAVVVVDCDAVPLACAGEATLDAAEGAIAFRTISTEAPSSCATAMAAVALSALCRPGIGSVRSSI